MAEMDVDFSDVTDVRIPQGTVKYIEKYENNTTGPLYWKRPFQYPTRGICLRAFFTTPNGDKVRVYNLPWGLYDYYGMTKLLELPPTSTNSDGSVNVYYQEPIVWLPTEDDAVDENNYSSSLTWIKSGVQQKGLTIASYQVKNEDSAKVFPTQSGIEASGSLHLQSLRNNIESSSPPITLYAVPSAASLSDSTWALGKLIKSDLYQDWEYQLIEHETDVVVTGYSTPLINRTFQASGVTRITAARTDFNEFKTKYDTATGGKFTKSTYPYLIGAIRLLWYGGSSIGKSEMYLAFKVKR